MQRTLYHENVKNDVIIFKVLFIIVLHKISVSGFFKLEVHENQFIRIHDVLCNECVV